MMIRILWSCQLSLFLLWPLWCDCFVIFDPERPAAAASCRSSQGPHHHCCSNIRSGSASLAAPLFSTVEKRPLAPFFNETEAASLPLTSSLPPRKLRPIVDKMRNSRRRHRHTTLSEQLPVLDTPPATKATRSRRSSSSNNINPATQQQVHQQQLAPSRIIFGTAALGKAAKPFKLLDAAYQKGFYRFDLARTYGGDGVSEHIFGAWMKERGLDRSTVEIITKGGMGQDKYGNPNRPVLTREALRSEVLASLDALQTDYVDMYMFHRDDPRIGVEQFVLWANELVMDGSTRRWGVSNWSFERFRQAYEFARQHNLEPPAANSPQYSLAIPQCEVWPTTQSISGPQYDEQIEWYALHNVELLCWEVLAKGFMAKPHLWNSDSVDQQFLDTPNVPIGSDEWRLQRIQKAYCYDLNYHRRNVAVKLARQHGCTLSQIATRYILSRGNHISVIFGSNNLDHLEDMVEVLQDDHWQLDQEAMIQLCSLMKTTTTTKPSSSRRPH